MITVICNYADGDTITTRFNGTPDEARAYFVGQTFNIGSVDDNMQRCISITVTGYTPTDADAAERWAIDSLQPLNYLDTDSPMFINGIEQLRSAVADFPDALDRIDEYLDRLNVVLPHHDKAGSA
jgi:hypothetical protein